MTNVETTQLKNLRIGLACNSVRLDGGMGRYAIAVIRGLNELGIEPVVFTKKIDPAVAADLRFKLRLINCRFVPGKFRDNYFNFRMRGILKEYPKFDALLSCNRCTSATVGFCGGTHRGYLRGLGKKTTLSDRIAADLEETFYRNCDLVVAHSQGMADEIENLYGIDAAKIRTIYTPFDASRFNADPLPDDDFEALRRELDIPEGRTTFLFPSAGSHYFKGLDFATAFFNATDLPVTLLVAGRAVPESRNVRYIGFRKDIERLYKFCDWTLLASRYEPLGMVAVESVLSGTPVVLSDKICANEIIDDEAKILFKSLDAKSLEEAVRKAAGRRIRLSEPERLVRSHDSETEHVLKVLEAAGLYEPNKTTE